MFEFEIPLEVDRVIKDGTRSFVDFSPSLKKWSQDVWCKSCKMMKRRCGSGW